MSTALGNIRVLDLTWVWSGPLAGRILADLGAEVVHITGRSTISEAEVPQDVADRLGIYPENDPGRKPWNRMSSVNDFGRNKLGITLELNTPEGTDIFKQLLKISDVVLENFSPRVMPNFGLDYPKLKEINPNVVMCSMPGFGLSGPYRDYVSYGTNLDPASGLASLMGYPDGEAHMSGNAYPDPVAALNAVNAVLIALFHRRRTGQGQHIDLSQAESATSVIGEAVLAYTLNGKIPRRTGNRHPYHAPHGCYRCQGEDKWVVIAVSSEEQWNALCKVMERSALMDDERYVDRVSRHLNHDGLDESIEDWTRRHTHYQAMHRLQKAGVPSGAVLDALELTSNEHLADRNYFVEVDHPEVGRRKHCTLPLGFSGFSTIPAKAAPCLGEHNHFVLGDLLGLSESEIARLEEKEIIGNGPLTPETKKGS
ncbi:MAG: CoA transferase [Proteobacteria bacterium]|nr:CoA transferase [Pseudomonadota bacterium]